MNVICNTDKYAYGKGYIYLPIELTGLPKEFDLEGETLSLKSSFHVSLVCVKDLLAKYDKENLEQMIFDQFCAFVAKNDINFLKFTGEFHLAKHEERKSLVAICEVSNLDNFTSSLSQELGLEISLQPTHVTLYTLQPDMGIGLNNPTDLENKSVIVDVPEAIKQSLIS